MAWNKPALKPVSLTGQTSGPKWRHSLGNACNGGVAVAFGGAIAQLGERVVRNDEVGGSIPPGSTILLHLAQAVILNRPIYALRLAVRIGHGRIQRHDDLAA
jgi:hypothetical protein